MLITFRTKAHADITMFGDVAVELLKLAGMTGDVPTAILAPDIPSVVARLEAALAQRAEDMSASSASVDAEPESQEEPDEPPVPMRHRALPLLELLRDASAAGADVIVSASR